MKWISDTRTTAICLHSGNDRPNFKCNRGIDIWGSNPDFWNPNHRSLPSSRAYCSRYIHDIFQYQEFRGRMNLCFVLISEVRDYDGKKSFINYFDSKSHSRNFRSCRFFFPIPQTVLPLSYHQENHLETVPMS